MAGVRQWGGRVVLWLVDYAAVSWWQARALLRPESPDQYAGPHRPPADAVDQPGHGARAATDPCPVLLLPGVYETWQVMRPLARDLRARGHPVHAVPTLGYNHGPVTEMAVRVARLLLERDLHGVVVVAHSKGGLIGKQLMLQPGVADRIAGMVTVGTPFGGSRYAGWFPLRSVRSLSPRDPVLLALAAERSANARVTSVYAAFDPHVPAGSALPGARNIEVPTTGHFRVLSHRQVRTHVVAEVEHHCPGR